MSQRIWGENKKKHNPYCSAGVIAPDGAGNYLLISLVKIISWMSLKIVDSHNVLCAPNRHLIKFSTVSYTSAPHFTLKFFDSITALVQVCLLGHLAGNWIGVSTCHNTR